MSIGVPAAGERGKVAAQTTARKSSAGKKKSAGEKKAAPPKICKGRRVYVHRSVLKHAVEVGTPGYAAIEAEQHEKFRFHGTVVKSTNKLLWQIRFDLLPLDHNLVVIHRKSITVLAKGEEEHKYDPKRKRDDDIVASCSEIAGEDGGGDDDDPPTGNGPKATGKKAPNYGEESNKEFLALTREEQARAKTFLYKFGADEAKDSIKWTILDDLEQITVDPMEEAQKEAAEKATSEGSPASGGAPDNLPGSSTAPAVSGVAKTPPTCRGASFTQMTHKALSPLKKDIPWNPDTKKVDYNATFFEHFFPSVEGKAKVLDEYLWNEKCPMYATVKKDNIRFHRPDAEDPDYLVSLFAPTDHPPHR